MRPPAVALLVLAACGSTMIPQASSFQGSLERAADLEGVPRALVIAIAYVDSRWAMNTPSPDGGHGLMHLIDRADAPAALSMQRAAQLTGFSTDALKTDPYANARGGAALLRAEADKLFAQYRDLQEDRLGDWYQAVMRLSGSDDPGVADSYAAQVYRLLRDGHVEVVDGEVVRLSPQEFDLSGRAIWGSIEQDLSGEYCPNGACVAFVPASTSNYTAGRGGNPITTIVIHDMEGSYSGSISWFQNPSAQACAHYMLRSSDGQITQMVHNADTAWHAGNWTVNQHSVGIEHEGYAHTGAQWFTEAMYKSSAALTRWLADTHGIPKDRTHIIGHYEVPDPNHSGWYGGAGHHHDPCDSWAGDPTWHNNIACYWDWNHYMDLVTGGGGGPATGTLKGFVGDACCGISTAKVPLAGATVTAGGQTVKTDSTGTYTFTLAPGTYTPVASFAGYDNGDHSSLGAGYSAQVSVAAGATTWGSILLHKTAPPAVSPPVVKITTPADGSALSSTPAPVRGTISDTSVTSVKVNGKDTAASNGSFAASVDLAAGANTITVSATNSGGTGTASVEVSYAPPATGVQGFIKDPSGGAVSGAGVTVAGKHAVSNADGSYEVGAAPGTYTLTVDAAGFQAASEQVTVPSDRLAIADFTLQPSDVPAAPHVRIDSPNEGEVVNDEHVVVSGVAEIPALRTLLVDDEEVAVMPDGSFAVEIELLSGSNEITVTAYDTDSHMTQATVHVDLAPIALPRTGCSSAPADLFALLAFALWWRSRQFRQFRGHSLNQAR